MKMIPRILRFYANSPVWLLASVVVSFLLSSLIDEGIARFKRARDQGEWMAGRAPVLTWKWLWDTAPGIVLFFAFLWAAIRYFVQKP